MQLGAKLRARWTTEAIIGGVTGTLFRPEAVLLGLWTSPAGCATWAGQHLWSTTSAATWRRLAPASRGRDGDGSSVAGAAVAGMVWAARPPGWADRGRGGAGDAASSTAGGDSSHGSSGCGPSCRPAMYRRAQTSPVPPTR